MPNERKSALQPLPPTLEEIGKVWREVRRRRKRGEDDGMNRRQPEYPQAMEFRKWRRDPSVRSKIQDVVAPMAKAGLIKLIERLLWELEEAEKTVHYLHETNQMLQAEQLGHVLADAVEMREDREKAKKAREGSSSKKKGKLQALEHQLQPLIDQERLERIKYSRKQLAQRLKAPFVEKGASDSEAETALGYTGDKLLKVIGNLASHMRSK